ncbi:Uncharacterised protein [Mycobacteroides abscessus subsp. abscessus]|nr:Uncharacterised protein [Mycobacteroides abscessus subsp. abscessus]
MVVTTTPPALTTANQQATSQGVLGERSSTRLPGTRPKSSVSTRAIRLAVSSRSRIPQGGQVEDELRPLRRRREVVPAEGVDVG